MIKIWFKSLDKREQLMVLVAAIALSAYAMFALIYQGLIGSHDKAVRQYEEQTKTLEWMRSNVQQLKALKQSTATSDTAGMSLAQLAENAAKKSATRIARFQPKDDTEAQVWLEREEFNNIVSFLYTLEVENGLVLEDVAITSANAPGLVNLRLQFAK